MRYNPKESGMRIADLRKQKGLTQEQLADHLEISTSHLGKIERGHQGLSIDLLLQISFYLGTSTDYILLGCNIRHYDVANELGSIIEQLTELKNKL